MVSNDITTAATRNTKASKALDTMRARLHWRANSRRSGRRAQNLRL